MTILASDGGVPALSSEAQLTITILDSNDHAPTVSLTPCSTSENDDQGNFEKMFFCTIFNPKYTISLHINKLIHIYFSCYCNGK